MLLGNRALSLPLVPLLTVLVVGCAPTSDRGDLRAEARMIAAAAEASDEVLTLSSVLGPSDGPVEVPPLIRVWRRGLDGSRSSCEGRVDVLDLEEYVRGVVPSEWMPAWNASALEAGAIAARTYAAFWVAAGGRYDCADVDDTTWTQVYRDTRHPRTDAAVEATLGAVAVRDGSLVFAEYSAENGDPTAHGVAEPHCRNRRVQGHGRGMCQWGTERWGRDGKDAAWMVGHYYGAELAWADEALIDGVEVTVRSGERFELTLKATNPGPEPWPAGAVSVATDVSAFVDEAWAAPDRPAVHGAPVDAAETVTVTWWMRAPEVSEPTTYAEFYWLDGPALDRPGATGSWHLTVLPPEPEVEVEAPEPARRPWAWLALGVVLAAGASLAVRLALSRRTR